MFCFRHNLPIPLIFAAQRRDAIVSFISQLLFGIRRAGIFMLTPVQIRRKTCPELKCVSRRINLGSGPLLPTQTRPFGLRSVKAKHHGGKKESSLKKLYVGNLPFQASEEQLNALFDADGRYRGKCHVGARPFFGTTTRLRIRRGQ